MDFRSNPIYQSQSTANAYGAPLATPRGPGIGHFNAPGPAPTSDNRITVADLSINAISDDEISINHAGARDNSPGVTLTPQQEAALMAAISNFESGFNSLQGYRSAQPGRGNTINHAGMPKLEHIVGLLMDVRTVLHPATPGEPGQLMRLNNRRAGYTSADLTNAPDTVITVLPGGSRHFSTFAEGESSKLLQEFIEAIPNLEATGPGSKARNDPQIRAMAVAHMICKTLDASTSPSERLTHVARTALASAAVKVALAADMQPRSRSFFEETKVAAYDILQRARKGKVIGSIGLMPPAIQQVMSQSRSERSEVMANSDALVTVFPVAAPIGAVRAWKKRDKPYNHAIRLLHQILKHADAPLDDTLFDQCLNVLARDDNGKGLAGSDRKRQLFETLQKIASPDQQSRLTVFRMSH